MAASIVSKSKIREINEITVKYCTLLLTEIGNSIKAWALPGNVFTLSEETARERAAEIDKTIRTYMKNPNQLLA
ncbi:hypothetical protein [Teredinibacter turnerae]|uniref:hypothetical protein n=1 Tax=Teredinibacter turnerae TaxID=2426 RepID=UPI000318735C|nr:hypothetical protein [Teredinibacter turnerae]